MSDVQAGADIAALMQKLSLAEQEVGAARAEARIIVATDWSKAAAPLSILKAFRALVPPSAPIRLVFAVPHEPNETDAACIEVLADAVEGGLGLRGLEVESFQHVAEQPYDCAVVPNGNAEQVLTEMSGVIVRLADLMRHYDQSRASGQSPRAVTANPGDQAALRDRLAAYQP